MKQILISILIICCATGLASAGWDGNGNPEYPNTGYVTVSSSHIDGTGAADEDYSVYYDTDGNTVYYHFSGYGSITNGYLARGYYCADASETLLYQAHASGNPTASGSIDFSSSTNHRAKTVANTLSEGHSATSSMIMRVSPTSGSGYNVTGNTCGVTWIKLYVDDLLIDVTNLDVNGSSYSMDIFNNIGYKIIFSDYHTYEFTCTGDEEYDRDLCDYYTLNLLDNCGNPLIEPYTTIFRDMTEIIYEGSDNPIKLNIPNTVLVGDYLNIIIDTTDGGVQYNDYVTLAEYDLYHPMISWNMNIHIIDDSTSTDIAGANVILSQTCSIDLPNMKNVITPTSGHALFTGLSNSNMAISVTKTGYNDYSKTITVGSIFNAWSTGGSFTVYMNSTTENSTDDYQNGTHVDTSADGTGEETLPENHGYGCGVYFKNTDGVITDTINDTDPHVDMYYWIKGSDATLKFQHQINTYWYTDEEYSVSNNTFEYRRILNGNFSDYTSAYRGYIYNATQDCNSIQRLYVINQTYEAETDYENLTAHCWIKNKLSGNEIDYRSNIKCVIYANSTNTSLLDITVHFMNQSTEVDSIILNWADFVSGSPKWYYTWYPDYNYESGYNYTLNITGFDRHQLDTDEVWTADIIGNTLTVYVKDNHNAPLAYSTVFVQGWGSSALDSSTDISITGLSDGNVQYKATKSGYLSSSWSNTTLDGSDESVTCIMVQSATESVTGYKLKDSEIKEFFIPLMYMLLIMILIGGLMNAAKK